MFKEKCYGSPKLTRERLAKSMGTLVTNIGESCPESHVLDLIIDALAPEP
jgi:hypothetical protein